MFKDVHGKLGLPETILVGVDPQPNVDHPKLYLKSRKLDDGWPESVEEQGLLLLVWRRNFRNDV